MTDPVLARRASASPAGRRSASASATRCSALAVVLFFVGFAVGFDDGVGDHDHRGARGRRLGRSRPAIVFGYGVKAADQEARRSARHGAAQRPAVTCGAANGRRRCNRST